ncbi:MAG: nitroreductase [Lachnospiraceae bacterium]|nr:nitroreductase [Lachnospiraceae bacterium]
MTEPEALKERHSVRNYLEKAIEQEKLDALNACIAECNQAGNLHLQLLVDAGKTFNRLLNRAMGLSTAPSVIAMVGPEGQDLDERIGFYGEKIVLLAQMLGLNTCWAGTFNAGNVPAQIAEGERLVIVIAIGYGRDTGKAHRSKTAEQVSNVTAASPEWFRKGVEYALLAPTAINQQKFRIELKDDGSVNFTDLGGVFSKVDLGIVRYHFELAKATKD